MRVPVYSTVIANAMQDGKLMFCLVKVKWSQAALELVLQVCLILCWCGADWPDQELFAETEPGHRWHWEARQCAARSKVSISCPVVVNGIVEIPTGFHQFQFLVPWASRVFYTLHTHTCSFGFAFCILHSSVFSSLSIIEPLPKCNSRFSQDSRIKVVADDTLF